MIDKLFFSYKMKLIMERDTREIVKTKEKIMKMSLGDFKVEDLRALMGLLGLIDGITSAMHPNSADAAQIENRLNEIKETPES